MRTKVRLILSILLFSVSVYSQRPFNPDTVKAGVFDNGKMWTFDFLPTEYFENTYQFKPSQNWFDKVRMSALRFANSCSASFVSADGLVMTNHHCSRDAAIKVQKPTEKFLEHGFYAATSEEERKVPDLYVDQLVMLEDITDRVQQAFNKGKTDVEKVQLRTEEFDKIKKEYEIKENWKGLTLQPITLYQGARYSLYGFKRYTDVRLVALPELAIAHFGGDYDNFTYPRYCLDFAFFRVYDENGKPLRTQHYFKFNPNGVKENEPVFVVGNPGSTNRQATISILEYLRDYSLPTFIELLSTRSKILQQYNETAKNDSITNVILSYENGIKAFQGRLDGLRDPYIMARRRAFEKDFQNAISKNEKSRPEIKNRFNSNIWKEIESTQSEIKKNYYEVSLFTPDLFNSNAYNLATTLNIYSQLEDNDTKRRDDLKKNIINPKQNNLEIDRQFLIAQFKEINKYKGINDPYLKAAFKYGGSADAAADFLLKNTKIYDDNFRKELIEKGNQAITNSNDPLISLTRIAATRYEQAQSKLKKLNATMANLRANLSIMMYDAYGTHIPPDATFSLRLSDGVVKSYKYNGTKAPLFTTFYGLYDRYHSFENNAPWNLPEKWKNPPSELLKEPLNFVSTNDIIGGNSGSPMINRNGEVVGLIFDGNMESLPGNYIYLPESNRTISVHAGGIIAGLKHIYKADRIINELLQQNEPIK